MSLHSDDAFILDLYDLHEYDRIVVFLAREAGKKRGVARGARRKYSRYAGQLQPLARARITWFEPPGRDLVRISEVATVRPADRLQRDLEGILTGAYLADQLAEFAQESEDNDLLFRLLDATLLALEAGVDRGLAARYFEAWVLRLAGIYPPPELCPECGRPFGDDGAVLPATGEGLVCPDCGAGAGSLQAPAPVLGFLRRIGRETLGTVAATAPPPEVLDRAELLAATVRRRFLQRELASYRVLKETLTDDLNLEP